MSRAASDSAILAVIRSLSRTAEVMAELADAVQWMEDDVTDPRRAGLVSECRANLQDCVVTLNEQGGIVHRVIGGALTDSENRLTDARGIQRAIRVDRQTRHA